MAELDQRKLTFPHSGVRGSEALMAELDAFVDTVGTGTQPEVGFDDGRRALIPAEAACVSCRERRLVPVSEIA